MPSDFFDNHDGNAADFMSRPLRAVALDVLADLRLAFGSRLRHLRRQEALVPRQRILIVGVEVPSRTSALARIVGQLADSRHDVVKSTVVMKPKGKFENIADAIEKAGEPLSSFDWLMIADDDISLPRRFTDRYIAAAYLGQLMVSQPSHRFLSYATYQITRRKLGHVIRQTAFVEIGPLTVIKRDAFEALLPFPSSRWAYGIDVVWADCCRRNGWRMGIVDGLPIRHLRPVAAAYDMDAAIREGRDLLACTNVEIDRNDMFAPGRELALP